MQYCQACGAENTDTAPFCGQCGAPLVAGAVAPPPVHQQTLSLQTLLHNRYLIRKLLGEGGMGAVYLAKDQQVFDRLCVVKEMLPYYTTPAEQQQAEQNFEREARLLSSLRNPGVPQVYDYFIEGNRYYLVMEWVEGENLEERIARLGGPLPESDVLDYALQLVNILVYMAKQNPPIIHRDIKPANIIVDDEGEVKLVDFGIAKATAGTGQITGMSIPLGTPGYSPPEQYSGQVEPRTDVYALGATLHHLLTGWDPRNEPPFQFPPVRTLAPEVSPEMEELLTQMLQTDVALRPTPMELRAKLEFLAALPTISRRAPAPIQAAPVPAASVLHRMCPQILDFGVMLPNKIRWQPLVIKNSDISREFSLTPNEPQEATWLTANPSIFACRAWQQRTITVRAWTSGPTLQAAHKTMLDSTYETRLTLSTADIREIILVKVRVRSVPRIQVLATTLINILAGSMLGLLLIGMLGNLVLRLLGHDVTATPVTIGACVGGLIMMIAGFWVQDTMNLVLALASGSLACSIVGAVIGMLLGLPISLFLDNGAAIPTAMAAGLLIGGILGALYVSASPIKWKVWPF